MNYRNCSMGNFGLKQNTVPAHEFEFLWYRWIALNQENNPRVTFDYESRPTFCRKMRKTKKLKNSKNAKKTDIFLSCITFLVLHRFQSSGQFQIPLIISYRMVYKNINFDGIFMKFCEPVFTVILALVNFELKQNIVPAHESYFLWHRQIALSQGNILRVTFDYVS